jgi:hypothetical protein
MQGVANAPSLPAVKIPIVTLNGRQRAVQVALGRKSSDLVTFYVGAVSALAFDGNPDRLAHAAQGVRELIEKFPQYVDVAMPAHGERMGVKVNELESIWGRAVERSKCRTKDRNWEGEIDQPLKKFLAAVGEFYDWKREHIPRRRAEIEKTLASLDPSGRPLPPPLQDRNVDVWTDMREFFQDVAHHRVQCTPEQFGQWMEALELFLLERLQPRTFDDFGEIDQVLGQAARGGTK